MRLRELVVAAALVAAVCIAAGCGGGGGNSTTPNVLPSDIYSTFKVGATWTYEKSIMGSTSTTTTEIIGTKAFDGKTCLEMVDTDGDIQNYQLITAGPESGVVVHALRGDDDVYRAVTPPVMLLPPVSRKDYSTTTTYQGDTITLSGHVERVSETVTVPAGTFNNVVHISTHTVTPWGNQDGEYWLAPSVGWLKQTHTADGATETYILTGFHP